MTQGLLRSTVNGQRSHPDGSLREKNISTYHEYLRVFFIINVITGIKLFVSSYHKYLRVFFCQPITGIIQKYPCDTRDTWRPVNAPQGNLLNLFNQLIIITLRLTYLRVFLSTDYRD